MNIYLTLSKNLLGFRNKHLKVADLKLIASYLECLLVPGATFEQVSRSSLVMFERCEERALFDRWAIVDFIAYLKTRSVAERDDPEG